MSTRRPGLPDPKSIISTKVFVPAASAARPAMPAGKAAARITRQYTIIRTSEVDPYDSPPSLAAIAPIGAALAAGERFQGTARRAAKLSIGSGKTEAFADIQALLKTLLPKSAMTKHKPPITTDANSARASEEERNVRLRAYLYAASREADNDFHLIIGRGPRSRLPVYMTIEISGLPSAGHKSFSRLKAARESYKQFFGSNLPGPTYDYYDPPIPLEVAGSLFFDMSHANGQGPGPQSLRKDIPTIWEIHPISKIVLGP